MQESFLIVKVTFDEFEYRPFAAVLFIWRKSLGFLILDTYYKLVNNETTSIEFDIKTLPRIYLRIYYYI